MIPLCVSTLLVYWCPADVLGHFFYLKYCILFEVFCHVRCFVWAAISCVILHVGDRLCPANSFCGAHLTIGCKNPFSTVGTIKSHNMMCLGCKVIKAPTVGIMGSQQQTENWDCKSLHVGIFTATVKLLFIFRISFHFKMSIGTNSVII